MIYYVCVLPTTDIMVRHMLQLQNAALVHWKNRLCEPEPILGRITRVRALKLHECNVHGSASYAPEWRPNFAIQQNPIHFCWIIAKQIGECVKVARRLIRID